MSTSKVYDNYSTDEKSETHRRVAYYLRRGYVGRDHLTPREYLRSEIIQDINAEDSYARDQLLLPTSYSYWLNALWSQNDLNQHHNRLVGKLREAVGPQSSLGSSIFAEGKESASMLVNTLTEIHSIAKAIRRKDITALKKVWSSPRRVQEAMAEAGGRWLQFSWGWKPLVQTVADTLDVLAQDPAPKRVTVKTSMSSEATHGSKDNNRTLTKYTGRLLSKASYDVHITNGNLWLLNSLELLNPAIWVWEAIPFSWLADYFVQVGDVIGSLNQFAGVDLKFRYHTSVVNCKARNEYRSNYGQSSPPSLRGISNASLYDFHRTVNSPLDLGIKLTYNVTNPLTSSFSRGMNICSFLATRLR